MLLFNDPRVAAPGATPLAKHLARAHDGEVSVTSELGTGSTFTIELPG